MLTYPAADRNKQPILDVLVGVLPRAGRVLEIASGTGQHVVHFAAALPQLTWLPSDPDAAHRESILERRRIAGLANLEPPLALDVLHQPWPIAAAEAVVCINLIHIAPWNAGIALVEECSRLLDAGGVLYLYGPYRRDGRHTAPSNEAFDADLRSRNPQWGVRDLEAVEALCRRNGFERQSIVEMPANNLSVVFRRQR